MSALVVLMVVLAVAALHRARNRSRRVGAPQRSRTRAVLLVIAIMGFQSVIGAQPALAAECGEAPNPERPGSGMVGAMDPAEGNGEAGSAYVDYSYAGMVWHVYETDCGPLSGITDPNTTLDTWAGNQLFNIAKNIVGATNALHYTVMEGGLFTPLYDAIKAGTEKVYNNIYAQLFGLAALLLAIMMFRHIWRGDLPSVSKRALFALGGLWLAASSFALLRYYDHIDRAIVQTTTNIQAGFVDESDNRVVRHILPTNLHNEIIYKNWTRGQFGAPDSPQAEKYGMDLLDAQAFTWEQIRNGDDADQAVVDGKKAEYKRIASEQGPATGYFTGEDGSRTGAGFLAFLQSLIYSLFQLLAKASVLLAQVLVRLLTLTAPLIGLVALLHHDILRKVARVAGAVAFNLVVLSVLAGVHALLLQAIFSAGPALSMLTQMAMAALVTILLFVVGRPVRRLWQMMEMSTRTIGAAIPSAPTGLFSRFRRSRDGQTPQDQFWQNVRDTDIDAVAEPPGPLGSSTASGVRLRPEARNPVSAAAVRLDAGGALPGSGAAGSVGTAAGIGGAALAGRSEARAALPPGGTPNPARLGFNPAGGMPDGADPATVPYRSGRAGTPVSRPVDTAPVTDRRWDRGDYGDAVVVPSRLGDQVPGYATAAPSGDRDAAPAMRAPGPQPRRADAEVVGGRPVFVLYRPSRGLEVRGDLRDTDTAIR
ncbi:MAG: magnesium transporter [Haloechinothrix sp.]